MRHQLPWPAAPDVQSMPRAAVEVVVQAPFGPLRVTTTHLEYYCPGTALRRSTGSASCTRKRVASTQE